MRKKKSMPTIWQMPDDLWEEFWTALPAEKKPGYSRKTCRAIQEGA
jgi:hypothetical protein